MGKATPTPASLLFGELPCHDSGLPYIGRSVAYRACLSPARAGSIRDSWPLFGAGLAPPPRYRPFALRPIPTVSQYVTAWYGCAAVVSPCPWCFEPSSRVFALILHEH